MYHRVALILAVAFLAMACIHPEGVFGQSPKTGYGDFCVHLNGGTDVAHAGMMNTLEIYIANDAVLEGMTPAIEINFYCSFSWDMGYGSHPPVNEEGRAVGAWDNLTGLLIVQDFDDLSPEHIGFGGAAFPGGGLPDGPSDICYSLQFYIPGTEGPNPSGICVQPYFYPPSYQWIFADAGGNYPPDFCGQPVADPYDPVANPICFEILPNQPPEITNCPTSTLYSNYCEVINYVFVADDLEGDPYLFELVSGPGAIDQVSGTWTFAPDVGDLGSHICEVRACDAYDCGPICTFEIEITNEAPVFTGGCGVVLYAQPGQTVFNQLTADQPDCGPLVFSLTAANPPPSGPATILPTTGMFTFVPEIADTGTTVFTVRVDDEAGDYDECSFEVIVVQQRIVINEVLPWTNLPTEGDSVPSIVELYNVTSSAQDLTGWRIAGASLANEILLPDWSMPAGTYLIVNFGSGTDDPDFSDSVAMYYAHNLNWAFDNYADEVGLYSGYPDSQTIVDFVGWGRGSSSFGDAYTHAQATSSWPVLDFVELDGESLLGTVGRIPSGYDTDSSDDWRAIVRPRVTPMSPDNPIQLMPWDGSVKPLLVDHFWRAVHGASSYLLEIDDDSMFSSPFVVATLSDTTYADVYPLGLYYWRVSPDLPGDPYPAAEWSFVVDTGSTIDSVVLLVPQKYQHKDTQLLCIWDFGGNKRPGCSEDPGSNGPWDGEHLETLAHIKGCGHCSQYCTRAAIQMVNAFFGGSLTQDEISYKMFAGKALGPEGDLGHNKGTLIPEEHPTYSWAMGTGVLLKNHLPHPVIPWGDLKDEIDAGRPILALIRAGSGCHAVVFSGYKQSFLGTVKIMDPWPGFTGWYRYSRIEVVRYYVLQTGTNARDGDPNVLADPDGDSIMSFDEGVPRSFHCSANKKDTDDDQVDDKCEIRNYTFHDQPGYHPGCVHNDPSVSIADIDGDGVRAEGDCDSDNDRQFDGGEDSDGNGRNPVNPPADETCQFMDAFHHIEVNVDKDVYAFGEPVRIVDIPGVRETRTYHVNSSYNIEVGVGFPIKVDGDAIAHTDSFETDANGRAITSIITNCHNIGINHLYVDILDDGKYSFPFNWDPYCSWECDGIPFLGWHIGITLERFVEGFEWPFEFPTVCPSGGEVIDVDIFTPWWWYSPEWPQPPRDYWLGVSVPADLLAEETIWIDIPPSFVNQTDECSGTEIIPFASDAMIELDLNEQFGDEDTYWFGFAISDWELPDSLMVTDVVITMLPDAARGDEIPIQIRMGDSDYGWSPAYYRSIGIPYGPTYICGDADASGGVDIDDVVFLINYIFAGGAPPDPLESGDVDCAGGVDIDDVVYLIQYIFAGGPAPCDPDGDGVPDC